MTEPGRSLPCQDGNYDEFRCGDHSIHFAAATTLQNGLDTVTQQQSIWMACAPTSGSIIVCVRLVVSGDRQVPDTSRISCIHIRGARASVLLPELVRQNSKPAKLAVQARLGQTKRLGGKRHVTMFAFQRLGDHGTLEMLDLLRQAAEHFANTLSRSDDPRAGPVHIFQIPRSEFPV